MNIKTTYKILDFLKSKEIDDAEDVTEVLVDPVSNTLDIWYVNTDGMSDVFELGSGSAISEFLEFLTSE